MKKILICIMLCLLSVGEENYGSLLLLATVCYLASFFMVHEKEVIINTFVFSILFGIMASCNIFLICIVWFMEHPNPQSPPNIMKSMMYSGIIGFWIGRIFIWYSEERESKLISNG